MSDQRPSSPDLHLRWSALPVTCALVWALGLGAWPSHAQAPATEVYLASLTVKGTTVTVGTPVNVSQNAGYDNQPSFLPDSSAILFTSNRDGKQTDIYRFDIAAKRLTQVTKTSDNEYSPLVTPDRKTFSTVRGDAQNLWRFNPDGSDAGAIIDKADFKVGYHVWIDATHLALFVLGAQGQPVTMQLWDTTAKTGEVVATSIARSLLMRPGTGTVSFISTAAGQPRSVKTIHPRTKAIDTLVTAVDGSQDAIWLPDGRFVMARGRTLHAWAPGATAFAELTTVAPGADVFDQITRIAVSADGKWLAFVAEPARSATDN